MRRAAGSVKRPAGMRRTAPRDRTVAIGGVRPARETRSMAMAQNRILDDFARLFTDAAGMAQGVRREAEGVMKAQLERLIRDMDVVSREEFEAVREMAILARDENDRLSARIAMLEEKLGIPKTPKDEAADI
jgi:BMFP domain-containing protein YqiC